MHITCVLFYLLQCWLRRDATAYVLGFANAFSVVSASLLQLSKAAQRAPGAQLPVTAKGDEATLCSKLQPHS